MQLTFKVFLLSVALAYGGATALPVLEFPLVGRHEYDQLEVRGFGDSEAPPLQFIPYRPTPQCTTCSTRELRCDGGQPSCSYCNKYQFDCKYDQTKLGDGRLSSPSPLHQQYNPNWHSSPSPLHQQYNPNWHPYAAQTSDGHQVSHSTHFSTSDSQLVSLPPNPATTKPLSKIVHGKRKSEQPHAAPSSNSPPPNSPPPDLQPQANNMHYPLASNFQFDSLRPKRPDASRPGETPAEALYRQMREEQKKEIQRPRKSVSVLLWRPLFPITNTLYGEIRAGRPRIPDSAPGPQNFQASQDQTQASYPASSSNNVYSTSSNHQPLGLYPSLPQHKTNHHGAQHSGQQEDGHPANNIYMPYFPASGSQSYLSDSSSQPNTNRHPTQPYANNNTHSPPASNSQFYSLQQNPSDENLYLDPAKLSASQVFYLNTMPQGRRGYIANPNRLYRAPIEPSTPSDTLYEEIMRVRADRLRNPDSAPGPQNFQASQDHI